MMAEFHLYKPGSGDSVVKLLELMVYFYRNGYVTIKYIRTHHTEEGEWIEQCSATLNGNRLLPFYRVCIRDDPRVTCLYVSVDRCDSISSFSSSMPLLTINEIKQMVDDRVVINSSKALSFSRSVKERINGSTSVVVNRTKIKANELFTYFSYICQIEPSIIRAYHVKSSHRIIFEVGEDDGSLMTLSEDGLTDQVPFDLHLFSGFDGDQDAMEQMTTDFKEWTKQERPLSPILKWV